MDLATIIWLPLYLATRSSARVLGWSRSQTELHIGTPMGRKKDKNPFSTPMLGICMDHESIIRRNSYGSCPKKGVRVLNNGKNVLLSRMGENIRILPA